ncbi:MAG: GT4 family glycosyltransferase PelF [Candidatus Zixiibacteriota bacterium]
MKRPNDKRLTYNMNKKIKVLHTVLNLGVAGLERIVAEICLRMDNNQFEVEVVCFHEKGHFADLLESNGIRVTLIEQNPNHVDIWQPMRLRKFLRKNKFDIIHTHTGTFIFSALAGFLARTKGIVYTDHGRFLVEPRVRLIEDYIGARLADKCVAVSDELKQYLIDKVKFPQKKLLTILNGVNSDTFHPGEKPADLLNELNIPPTAKIIGIVGRLMTIKDHRTLIEAFEIVNKAIPDAYLILIGDGPLREELYNYVQKIGLENHILFLGIRNDIPKLLRLLDIFVLSSLSEGTSVSLLEALASGVPSVVTDVGGNPSIVDNNQNGFLVPVKNPQSLAEAIIKILSDNNLKKSFSENAVAKINRCYSLDNMVNEYSKLYLEIFGVN